MAYHPRRENPVRACACPCVHDYASRGACGACVPGRRDAPAPARCAVRQYTCTRARGVCLRAGLRVHVCCMRVPRPPGAEWKRRRRPRAGLRHDRMGRTPEETRQLGGRRARQRQVRKSARAGCARHKQRWMHCRSLLAAERSLLCPHPPVPPCRRDRMPERCLCIWAG